MTLAFGILSAHESPAALAQLIRCLGNDSAITVHHDYSRQPDFALPNAPDAVVIEDFISTGWGSPGIARAVFRLIRKALEQSDFDYFQLLSASCLPLRPIAELRVSLQENGRPIQADLLDMNRDDRALMSHGHRVFCRSGKMASRLLGRSRAWYLGADPAIVHAANLGIQERPDGEQALSMMQWLGRQVHLAARAGLLDDHPFRGKFTPFIGSLWFCLRRDVCEYLVAQEDGNDDMPYLLGLQVCDEILFPTLLGNSGFEVTESNHLVNDFDGAHPRAFTHSDLPKLFGSRKFFARKFLTQLDDPARLAILAQVREPTHEPELFAASR